MTGHVSVQSLSGIAGHTLGAGLVVASSAFFAMAGIFTKTISSDAWTIACWRGLVGGMLITAYVLWRSGRGGLSLAFGWRGWAMVAVGVFASLGFIASFKYTYVANVAIIYAAVPLMAAALEWMILRVRPQASTVAMALLCLVGVGIIVSGGLGGGHFFGDMIAVAMTASAALYMVMIRAFRDTRSSGSAPSRPTSSSLQAGSSSTRWRSRLRTPGAWSPSASPSPAP